MDILLWLNNRSKIIHGKVLKYVNTILKCINNMYKSSTILIIVNTGMIKNVILKK